MQGLVIREISTVLHCRQRRDSILMITTQIDTQKSNMILLHVRPPAALSLATLYDYASTDHQALPDFQFSDSTFYLEFVSPYGLG